MVIHNNNSTGTTEISAKNINNEEFEQKTVRKMVMNQLKANHLPLIWLQKFQE